MPNPAKAISLRICLIYALFGLLWILSTDWLAIWVTQNVRNIILFEVLKGILFIGISAALLYWYVRRQLEGQNEIAAALSIANTELRQQHDLLDSFINSLPGVVYVVNSQRRLLRWNRRFEEITGRTASELKVLDAAELFPAADAPILQAGMTRALTEGTAMVEVSFLDRKGQATPYLFTGVRAMLDSGPCMVGVGIDITARKNAEAALRESEERYRLIVETAEEGIWMIDGENRTAFVNPKMAQMLGTTVPQMYGRSMFEFMDEEGRAIATANLERRREGIREQHEFKFLRADGTPLWAMLATNPIQNEARHYIGALAMVSDVTERRQAEESRKLSVSLLRATLESTADGLLVVDGVGKIVHFNRRFVELWRIPEAILALRDDQKALDFVADQLLHPEEFFAKVSQLYEAPEADSFDVVLFKDGRVFERYSHPQWLDTRPVGRVWSFRDVTERKRAEEALREAGERLHLLSHRLIEVQEAERRHLARELHDEIGQALTVIKLNLETLSRETAALVAAKRAADTVGLVERLLQNVRNLSLNLRPPMLDDLGLVPAVRWLLDQHGRATGRQVNFHHDLVDERFAPAIETACFRVAQEALTNVTRHSRANTVHVELHRQAAGLTLVVRDNGRGFDVAEARRRSVLGGSLGLVGMEERVTLAGGRLTVASSRDAGVELRAWFPVNGPEPIQSDGIA